MDEAPDAVPEVAPANPSEARNRWIRVGALVLVTVALVVLAKVSGVSAHLRPDEIHERMAAAGVWGPVGYLLAFSVGELAHVPGWVFIAAAVVAYGRALGTLLAFVGAIASLSVSFVVVRVIGGKPLGAVRWAFVRRLLAHLDEHPIRTVILLRLVLWLTPQLNYALALSNVRFRSYLLGSMVGLVGPVIVLSFLSDYLIRHFLH